MQYRAFGTMHVPQNEISLVYKLSKNHSLKKEIVTSIFPLKPEVFELSLIAPYGAHKK
jgi:hypothetical protein